MYTVEAKGYFDILFGTVLVSIVDTVTRVRVTDNTYFSFLRVSHIFVFLTLVKNNKVPIETGGR